MAHLAPQEWLIGLDGKQFLRWPTGAQTLAQDGAGSFYMLTGDPKGLADTFGLVLKETRSFPLDYNAKLRRPA